jgi:hypothetical protein
LDVEVTRIPEDSQKIAVPIPYIDEVLPLISRKESQQREVTMPKEDKNQNGKRNIEIKLTGKNARKLSKKRANIEKLQKDPEGNFAEIKFEKLELRWDIRTTSHGTSPWQSNITVGNSISIRLTPQTGRKEFMVR